MASLTNFVLTQASADKKDQVTRFEFEGKRYQAVLRLNDMYEPARWVVMSMRRYQKLPRAGWSDWVRLQQGQRRFKIETLVRTKVAEVLS